MAQGCVQRRIRVICFVLALQILPMQIANAETDGTRLKTRAQDSLIRLSKSLAGIQKDGGEWLGPLEGDASADVVPLIAARKFGFQHPTLLNETLTRVFSMQDPENQTWSAYPDGPPSLEVTGLTLEGLKIGGVAEDDPRVAKAWAWYRSHGGVRKLGSISKMILVFGGIIPANSVPLISTKFFALPKEAPLNIANVGFGRIGLVPLAVWKYYRDANAGEIEKPKKLDPERLKSAGAAFGNIFEAPFRFLDPLRQVFGSKSTVGSFLNTTATLAQSAIPTSADFWAQEGLGWILDHQDSDGTWGGSSQSTYFCMCALYEAQVAGIGDFSRQIQDGWNGIMSYRTTLPSGMTFQQTTLGPVMDTARVLTAIQAAPADLQNRLLSVEKRDAAIYWLRHRQIFKIGDWKILAPKAPPGAWAFEYENAFYPDADDTAMVLESLAPYATSTRPLVQYATDRGLRWLLSMQNRDGGFAAWDKSTSPLLRLITNAKMASIPQVAYSSHADITSRALKALTQYRQFRVVKASISKACSFLTGYRKNVRGSPVGLWEGEWMVNYIYGTSQALEALLIAECWTPKMAASTAKWVMDRQSPSGGWGESPTSYEEERYIQGPETLTQTQFALSALLVYEQKRLQSQDDVTLPSARSAIDRGIDFMLNRIGSNDYPMEKQFTGVFIRDVWYARYHMLPHYEAVRVLGSYLSLLEGPNLRGRSLGN